MGGILSSPVLRENSIGKVLGEGKRNPAKEGGWRVKYEAGGKVRWDPRASKAQGLALSRGVRAVFTSVF